MQLYDRVLQFYKELPASFQQDLKSICPDLERSAHQKRGELLTPETNILVAGNGIFHLILMLYNIKYIYCVFVQECEATATIYAVK